MENITSAQVKEAIDQLAAMTAAASITPEAVASVMEKLRNLTDAERQQIVEVASAYLTEINTKSQEWLNRLLSTGGSADKIVTKNGSNVQTELDTLGQKIGDIKVSKQISAGSSVKLIENLDLNANGIYLCLTGDWGANRILIFANNDVTNARLVDNVVSGEWYKINKDINITTINLYCVTLTESVSVSLNIKANLSILEPQVADNTNKIDYLYNKNADKISDLFHITENLIDITKSVEGKFYTPSGESGTSDSWRYIDIPINSLRKYSISCGRHMACFYKGAFSKANVVGGIADNVNDEICTLPEEATHIRLSFVKQNDAKAVFAQSDYIVTIDDVGKAEPSSTLNVYSKNDVDNKFTEHSTLVEDTEVTHLFTKSVNLVDVSKSTENKYVTPTGSSGTNESWRYLDLRVNEGENYSISCGRHMVCFYSVSPNPANVITGGVDSSHDEVMNIPNGATIMRVSFQKKYDTKAAIVKANTIIPIENIGKINPSSLLNVYSKEEVDEALVDRTTYINVTPSSNLREILDGINDSSISHKYVILLAAGTYDISQYYDAEYIAASKATTAKIEYGGLFVPPWCKLVGVGNRDDVVLTWDMTEKHPRISTINLYLNSELENITVKSTNLRYACHDDWIPVGYEYEDYAKFERTIKNCKFIGNGNFMGSAYGAGYKSGCKWLFESCDFITINSASNSLYMHNNNGFRQSSQVKFVNCRFYSPDTAQSTINFASLNNNSVVVNDIYMYGCGANKGIVLSEDSADVYGKGIKVRLRGYGNTFGNTDVLIRNTDGVDYASNVDLI